MSSRTNREKVSWKKKHDRRKKYEIEKNRGGKPEGKFDRLRRGILKTKKRKVKILGLDFSR